MNSEHRQLMNNGQHILAKQLRINWVLYLFLCPALIYLAIFCYWPMYGVQIAFRDYTFANGIGSSPWVGLKWFTTFFESPKFGMVITNTLITSIYSLIAGFPIPIIFALLLNYIGKKSFKRLAQTVSYMPHFISIIVLVSMMNAFFSPANGFVNTIVESLGGDPIYFFGKKEYYYHLYVWSGIWQETGWGAIIYIAALSTVSPELHEAAVIDGATKLRRIWHIDIPSIVPTMVILLILRAGSIMSVGFDKSFAMQNSLNLSVSEVISTYVYKMGIKEMRYSFSSAIGLFNNATNFLMLTIVNFVCRRLSGSSLW